MITNKLTLFAIVLLATIPAFGQGVLVFDQQSSTNETTSPAFGAPISQSGPLGQSFTPSLSAVGFVRLWSLDLGHSDSLGASIYVNVRSGSITGPILGSSDTVDFPAFVNGNTNQFYFGITNFVFSTPVAVTPGTKYYFEYVEASGTTWSIGGSSSYGYAGGDMIVSGLPLTSQDSWFREGVIGTPEPASWALMALGGGVLVVWRRRRERRSSGKNDRPVVK